MKKILFSLCGSYGDSLVESHLFYFYLDLKNINIEESSILSNYFSKFKLNSNLLDKIKNLKLETFEDLEKSQELLIPSVDRKINGAFFTPRNIVDKIIDEVSPKEIDKCADISCGCGAFLIGLIKYFKINHNKSIKLSLKENIYGFDILGYNIRRTKILISIFSFENGEIITDNDFNLTKLDSIRNNWDMKFDAVVGNPPYVKFQDMDEELRDYLIKNFKTIQKGSYNLYFAFFELGYNLLGDKGKLGYITPNNYFTSLSGENLRSFFSSKKSINKIIDFNSKKVFDVLTYTCLTFLSKEANDSILFNKYFDGDFEKFIDSITTNLSQVDYNNLKDKKWRLLLEKDQSNIYSIENIGRKIGDLFTINVGIATLRDDLYFIDGKDEGGYFKTLENVKYYIEDELIKSIYKISDFNDQLDCENNDRKIIFPYKVVNKVSKNISEEEMKLNFPMSWEYFSRIKEPLLKRSKKEVLNPFFKYGRSQGLNKFGNRLLTPTFSKEPKFLKVLEQHSLYCNGYGVHYKLDQNKNSIFDNSLLQNPKYINTLQRILNSSIMNYYVKTTSVTIDGGYPCYQKNFIELFTIPEFTDSQLSLFQKLSKSKLDEELIKIYDLNLEL